MHVEVLVQVEDFSVGAHYAALRERLPGHAGAIANFVGLVRAADGPAAGGPAAEKSVQALHLEHYPGMTERSVEAIVEQAGRRWSLLDVVVIHRVGRMEPGDQIVFVQVASSHRPDAFAACEFIMDYLKTDAVFWKREDTAGRSRWVEATDSDRERVSDWVNDWRDDA